MEGGDMWGRHTETQTWYVLFQGRQGLTHRFWQPFLKRGFNHVIMLTGVDGGTLKVEPQAWGMIANHTKLHIEDAVKLAAPHMTAVVQVTVDYNRVPLDFQPRGFLHCVSVAQALLALRGGRWWFTPWKLYRYLAEGVQATSKDSHIDVAVVAPFVPFCKKG